MKTITLQQFRDICIKVANGSQKDIQPFPEYPYTIRVAFKGDWIETSTFQNDKFSDTVIFRFDHGQVLIYEGKSEQSTRSTMLDAFLYPEAEVFGDWYRALKTSLDPHFFLRVMEVYGDTAS